MRVLALLLLASLSSSPAPRVLPVSPVPQDVRVEVLPERPLLQRHRSHLSLQCDFRLQNWSDSSVSLIEVVLRELDPEGAMMRRRFVDRNGTAPSITTVIGSPLAPGGVVHLFNPFHHFELDAAPARLEFLFTFQAGTSNWTETVSFAGRVYETRTDLRVPMEGRVMVKDGHDFLSHHRRLGFDHPVAQSLGLEGNASRYAYDLVALGPNGEEKREGVDGMEAWYTWEAPVFAPGSGRVIRVENEFPDSQIRGGLVQRHARVSITDVDTFAGNYVVIDHGNGEFSTLGHLREGSLVVEVGQEVEAGELLGKIGLSGSVTYVHLHWHLQTSPSFFAGEGLPAAFTSYRLHRGSTSTIVRNAPADTGDVLQHVEED